MSLKTLIFCLLLCPQFVAAVSYIMMIIGNPNASFGPIEYLDVNDPSEKLFESLKNAGQDCDMLVGRKGICRYKAASPAVILNAASDLGYRIDSTVGGSLYQTWTLISDK